MAKHSPSREPKFHQAEMLDGVGRSTKAELAVEIRGWVFRRLVISKLYVQQGLVIRE